MALTKYHYQTQVTDKDLLCCRIEDSSIATAVDTVHPYYLQGAWHVTISFVDVLSGADEATLDGLVGDQDVEEAKAAKKAAINEYRDYKLFVEKYTWTDSNPYDIDSVSQFKMAGTLAYINAGNTLPVDFKWRDANNVDHDFTDQQFKDFGKAVWDRAEEIHGVAKTHKDAVDALTTVAAVEAYNYLTESPAWPT